MKPKLYFAAPLFSVAERTFNAQAAESLATAFDVFLPQVHGQLLKDLTADGHSITEARELVCKRDLDAIRQCEVLLIVLDGRAIDEGASFELGFAFGLGKRCIGLQTDTRRLLPSGNNPLIDGALERIFASAEEIVLWRTSTREPLI